MILLFVVFMILASTTFLFANLNNDSLGTIAIKSTGKEWMIIDTNEKVELKANGKQVCILYPDAKSINDIPETKGIYDKEGKLIKSETRTSKDISAKQKHGYCYTVGKEEYLKFGQHSTTVVYQDQNMISYETDYGDVNLTLSCEDVAQNDIYIYENPDNYKFGANGTFEGLKNCSYIMNSTTELKQKSNKIYFHGNYVQGQTSNWYEGHIFDFKDVCDRTFEPYDCEIIEGHNQTCYNHTANCEIIKVDDYNYQVSFLSDNDIDPYVEVTDIDTNAVTEGVVCEGSDYFCHLTTSDTYLNASWHFDVNHTTTAYDWTESDNDLTWGGEHDFDSGWKTNGLYGGAWEFDQSGDIFDSDVNFHSNISMCLWFNSDDWANSRVLMGEFENPGNTWMLYYWTGNGMSLWSAGGSNACAFGTTQTNVWHHVCVTNNNTDTHYYYNGSSECIAAASLSWGYQTTNDFIIGEWGGWDYNGHIDEVMIWQNYTLNYTDVMEIYNQSYARFHEVGNHTLAGVNVSGEGHNAVNVTLNMTKQPDTNDDGDHVTNISVRLGVVNMSLPDMSDLVFYVNFEGNLTADMSGSGLNTFRETNNNPYYNATLGLNGSDCWNFTDTPSDSNVEWNTNLGDIDDREFGFTMSVWAYPSDDDNNADVFRISGSDQMKIYQSSAASGDWRVYVSDGVTEHDIDSTSASSSKWTHLALVWDTSGYFHLYIDGSAEGSSPQGTTQIDNLNLISLGGTSGGFSGWIDEAMFFNRSLSATEVSNLFKNQSRAFTNTTYTAPQNATNQTNMTFTIGENAGFLIPDMDYISNSSRYWSPILMRNITFNTFTETVGEVANNYERNHSVTLTTTPSQEYSSALNRNPSISAAISAAIERTATATRNFAITGAITSGFSRFASYTRNFASSIAAVFGFESTYTSGAGACTWTNQSDGTVDLDDAGVIGTPRGLTYNGSDWWVASADDDFILHFDKNGNNVSNGDDNDGFEVLTAGSSDIRGVYTNNSDFWFLDGVDRYIYHFDANKNNVSWKDPDYNDVTDALTPWGLDGNNSDFWVVDDNDEFVFHIDANDNNASDGFNIDDDGATTGRGVAYNGSDWWVSDYTDDWVYHFDSAGNNMSDGFSTDDIGSQTPQAITMWGDNDIYILDFDDRFVYHVECITSGNSYERNHSVTITNTIALIRSAEFIRTPAISAALTLALVRSSTIARNLAQSLGITPLLTRTYGAIRNNAVTSTVSTGLIRVYGVIRNHAVTNTITAMLTRVSGSARSLSNSASITSALTRTYGSIRTQGVSIAVTSALTRTYGAIRNNAVSVVVTSSLTRVFSAVRNNAVSVAVTSSLTRMIGLIRNNAVSASITDSLTRTYGIERAFGLSLKTSFGFTRTSNIIRALTDSFTVTIGFIEQAVAVISDVGGGGGIRIKIPDEISVDEGLDFVQKNIIQIVIISGVLLFIIADVRKKNRKTIAKEVRKINKKFEKKR